MTNLLERASGFFVLWLVLMAGTSNAQVTVKNSLTLHGARKIIAAAGA